MRDAMLTEDTISVEEIFKGRIFSVQRLTVRLPDGKEALRDVVRHVGAAAIVALDADNRVTLVRQYRAAIGRLTWEIPAGKLDSPGEDPLACAKRELEEETGLRAAQWTLLSDMRTTPGFCDERICVYLARGLSQSAAHPDADEFVRVERVPLTDAVARVMSGELRDGKTIAGLLMAQNACACERPPIQRAPASARSLPPS